ncbi:MAG: pyridoxamine 5'-phosphate oxidase family protein [Gammaproteobacteria bacterium]|nr:pyridoxamine 5'-phosphate oxidase family protein [Gammaproteobacteria bacterium]
MPSRRKLIELTADEVRDYLDAEKTLIIVSNGHNGYPHPMPMWFAHEPDGTIRCTTFGKSQKVLNWRRNPKATLLVESGVEYAELKGVVIYATCEIIEDLDAVADTLVAINSRGRDLDDGARAKLREAVSGTASKRVVLEFTPKRYVTWDHAKLGGRY